jgi:hypothetical protein
MNLRDHPQMARKSGYHAWPPQWTTTHGEHVDGPVGEVGVLERVLVNKVVDNLIFLLVQYRGLQYAGALHIDDQQFADIISTLLKLHIGHSIKDIGDLDLSCIN